MNKRDYLEVLEALLWNMLGVIAVIIVIYLIIKPA